MQPHTTYEAAKDALDEMYFDVEADMGQELADAGYADLVRSVARESTPDVARELMRCELGFPLDDDEEWVI